MNVQLEIIYQKRGDKKVQIRRVKTNVSGSLQRRASLRNATNKFSNPTFLSKNSHVGCSAALCGSTQPLMDGTRD